MGISYNHTIFDLVYLLQTTLNLIFLEKNLVSTLLLQNKDCNFSMKIFLMKKRVFNFDFFLSTSVRNFIEPIVVNLHHNCDKSIFIGHIQFEISKVSLQFL